MDNIYISKRSNKKKKKESNYVNNLITRLLISLILFLGVLSLANSNKDFRNIIKKDILEKNINFNKVTKFYNKYLGKIIPLEEKKQEEMVFSEKLSFKEKKQVSDYYKLTVDKNYVVPVINSGLVVFIGEKEGFGNTVIIEGIDDIDYYYGNVTNLNLKLYDYVSKGSILGNVKTTSLFLKFIKDNKTLKYEEVIK